MGFVRRLAAQLAVGMAFLVAATGCTTSVPDPDPKSPTPAPATTAASLFEWPRTTGKGPLDQPPFLNRHSHAWRAYEKTSDPVDRSLTYQIAGTPTAIWLGGQPTDGAGVNQIEAQAQADHQTPEFVLYAIPERDCRGMHDGGLSDISAYEQWIDSLRAGIAGRPAVVIVEPDAIGMTCLSPSDRADRVLMLSYAIQTLSQDPATWVYVHAGSSRLRPGDILQPLIDVGIQHARGFALNISSYGSIAEEERYGDALVQALSDHGIAGMHYVIDTSRNGVGRAPAGSAQALHGACNQRDRALGVRPTPRTNHGSVDAFLWIKPPGETDGACFPGDPVTGWDQNYALDLVRRALAHGIISRIKPPR